MASFAVGGVIVVAVFAFGSLRSRTQDAPVGLPSETDM
jgi:hypothetical protein